MSDIDLYENLTDKYEEFQEKRPDYVFARKAFQDLALLYLKNKGIINIADFCCGTGNNTHLISQHLSINKATLVDVNGKFLEITKKSGILSHELSLIPSDILAVNFSSENDLVISMFAYHHVSNQYKKKYIDKVKEALKIGGILILGEIYSPNKETTISYYDHLIHSIKTRTPELEKFLRQTAQSDNFEYKVSQKVAHDQLSETGFKLLESRKIWPSNNEVFGLEVGTFVEVWELKEDNE